MHAHPHPAPPQPGWFTRTTLRVVDKPWVVPLAAVACAGAVATYAIAVDPTQADAGATPSCALKALTGFDCPGCGGTRALWYLLHGNIPEAGRHHFLAVFAVPFLVYFFVTWSWNRMFGTKLPSFTISPKAIAIFLAAWGVFSVLRNLPWAPFTAFYV
ncbi:DUF2752 domain-containing protein [Longispora albida]|uniref:DUF2752 domain-containing protein n=1 Tax=Longispora albida TaxID=203523 RepID=UPI00037BBFE3|nr:DUF2752 domain-containing protein [Longispora albida]